MRTIQGRWRSVLTSAEERTQLLQLAADEWKNLDETAAATEQLTAGFSERVGSEPETAALDVDVLEREYGTAKALRDEMRASQGVVDSLGGACGQLEPYLTPMGVSEVQARATTLVQAWEDVRARCDARSKAVGEALQKRKEFWDSWEEFESWLQTAQRKMDALNEIYSDDINGAIRKLEVSVGSISCLALLYSIVFYVKTQGLTP